MSMTIGKGIRLYNTVTNTNSNYEQTISTSTSTLPPIIVSDGGSKLRRKREVIFDKNIIGFDNSTINNTISSFDISQINSMDFQNQSLTNVSSTNIPTI